MPDRDRGAGGGGVLDGAVISWQTRITDGVHCRRLSMWPTHGDEQRDVTLNYHNIRTPFPLG